MPLSGASQVPTAAPMSAPLSAPSPAARSKLPCERSWGVRTDVRVSVVIVFSFRISVEPGAGPRSARTGHEPLRRASGPAGGQVEERGIQFVGGPDAEEGEGLVDLLVEELEDPV